MLNSFKRADYDLDAVYERTRQWREEKESWNREYIPLAPTSVSGMWVARLPLAFQVCGLLGSN